MNSVVDIISNALEEDLFEERPLSFVAKCGGRFLKIAKPQGVHDVVQAAQSDEAKELAKQEFDALQVLGGLAPDLVVGELTFIEGFACLVSDNIDGKNARDVLLNEKDRGLRNALLEKAIDVLGRFHSACSVDQSASLFAIDYEADFFLPLPENISLSSPCLVIEGFEIRNMMQTGGGDVVFFDPHELRAGVREDDLSRFVISLLMLTWARNGNPLIWRDFSLKRLIAKYEEVASVKVCDEVFAYFMKRNAQMRRYYAYASIGDMSFFLRMLAKVYIEFYFLQVRLWSRHNAEL